MLDKKITLVGYSGHAYVIAESAIEVGLDLEYYLNKDRVKYNPFKLRYLGYERNEGFDGWKQYDFILGIGNNLLRSNAAELISSRGGKLLKVIHADSSISTNTNFSDGVFISRNVSVNPFVQIGAYSILNTGCIVEHNCLVGESCHIAPGATLCGNVRIGDYSFIGANAVIKEGIKIGDNVIIGAGAVVINDIADNETVVGNPASNI